MLRSTLQNSLGPKPLPCLSIFIGWKRSFISPVALTVSPSKPHILHPLSSRTARRKVVRQNQSICQVPWLFNNCNPREQFAAPSVKTMTYSIRPCTLVILLSLNHSCAFARHQTDTALVEQLVVSQPALLKRFYPLKVWISDRFQGSQGS